MILEDLKGLRSAPDLTAQQKQQLAEDLKQRISACDWFTVGVMAPGADQALASLLDQHELPDGAVFLKANQRTGTVTLRHEAGLGEGLLISGQCPSNPAAEDTWGPLPLDFFI